MRERQRIIRNNIGCTSHSCSGLYFLQTVASDACSGAVVVQTTIFEYGVYGDAQLAVLGVFNGDLGFVLEVGALSRLTAEFASVLPLCLVRKIHLSHGPT